MEIVIKKLLPELAEDYLTFFDATPHDDGVDEHKCYCVCWSSTDFEREKPDFSTAQKRRKAAGEYVRAGKLQGLCGRQACGLVQCEREVGLFPV